MLRNKLDALADALISAVRAHDPQVVEGVVMTRGEARYRRLDLAGRAFAYVRARPKKRMVRVDVPGLWSIPRSRLSIPSVSGAALALRSELDINDAVRSLLSAVPR